MNLPEYVDYEITIDDKVEASKVDVNSIYHKKAESILRAIWEKDVFYKYSG
jgi:hypothetical protein